MTYLLAIGIAITSLGQQPRASITGAVRDEATGRPLAGAIITLPDLGQQATADSAGRYQLSQVPAGPNHLVFRFIGYAPRTIHALVPSIGPLDLTVSLRAVPARLQTLVVRGAPAFRGIEANSSIEPDRVVSMAAARNHPLLAEPDAFLALSGGPVSVEPESPSGVHIRGGASDHTAYQVDGIPVLSPYHAAGLFGALNPDALGSVRLTSAARTPDQPDALAGVISATTRSPTRRAQAQGSISTRQARLTVNGPLGANAGYLASVRTGFPAAFAPVGDASHVRGETSDWLGKLEGPVAGGQLIVLGTGSGNELGAAAGAEPVAATNPALPRHRFEWGNRSLGASWQRTRAGATTRLVGWSASSHADSRWADPSSPLDLRARRSDLGLLATIERGVAGGTGTGGLRFEARRIQYHAGTDSVNPSLDATASIPIVTGFVHHHRPIGDRLALTIGSSVALARAEVLVNPSAALRWQPNRQLGVTASVARFRQFAQSARNGESIVDRIFPTDLYLAAGTAGVPVATSDQGLITVDYRPSAATRVTAEAYHRDQRGLVLVAPRDARPFTAGAFAVGSGLARGASLEAAFSTARIGMLFNYGIDQVRLTDGNATYVPGYGATHKLEGGLILYPGPASSIRLGLAGAWGRRGTGVSGGFEWEGCNLIDRGCEFAGSPTYGGAVGGTRLPHYLRLDLGFRHHWHFDLRGRDVQLGVFGTVTNVLGRRNILTYAMNGPTGGPVPIEMRPFAPLVIGLDWRF